MLEEQEREYVCAPEGWKIALYSYWDDAYAPLAEIARPNWKAYCERNGYALVFFPGTFHLDPSRPQSYGDKGKFQLYYDLRGHAEAVMFLDIDSLFMNMDERIEDRIGELPFVWTYDDSGPLSGLWIAKTDDRTERHLRYAYERAARENNVRHGVIEPNGISDQDSLRDLMGIPPFRYTLQYCFPATAFGHCYESTYTSGKWIITFPGMSVEEKQQKMSEWVQR